MVKAQKKNPKEVLNTFLNYSGMPKPRENVWRSVDDLASLPQPVGQKSINVTSKVGPTKNPPHMKTPNYFSPKVFSTKEFPSPQYAMKYFRSPDEVSPMKKRTKTFAYLPTGFTDGPVNFSPADW